MKHSARDQQYQIHNPCIGEVLTLGDIAVTIKVTGQETNGAFALVESTVPPHFAGPPAHLHRHTTKAFYMVSGVLAFTLAEETIMVRQGGLVMVPPGLLHKFWNPTATPATYLTYLTPAGFEQYFLELAALRMPGASWPAIDLHSITALSQKYEIYPVDELLL